MSEKKVFQLIWGFMLVFAGMGVFFKIPQRMTQIASFEQSSFELMVIRYCLYLLGVLLIWGGGKKIYNNIRQANDIDTDENE